VEYVNYEELFVSCFFENSKKTNEILTSSGCNIDYNMLEKKEPRILFKGVQEMFSIGLNITWQTLKQYCDANLEKLPYSVYADLVDLSQSSNLVVDYAGYIIENYKKKLLTELCLNTADFLKNSKNKPDKAFEEIISAYEKIGNIHHKRIEIKTQAQLAHEFNDRYLEMQSLSDENLGVTCYDVLNENVLFDKGMTMFIGGRSGTGKTTFTYELINEYAKAYKTKALFISLEMPGVPLFRRSVATFIGKEKCGNISKTDINELLKKKEYRDMVVAETAKMFDSVLVYDGCGVTMDGVKTAITIARREHKSVDIVAIDYLGYMRATKGKTLIEQVGILAVETKELAKEFGIRVVMLSQVNREGGTDGTTPVSMHHFRESGKIEDSADIALGMWQSPDDKDRIHIKILKNREGEKDIIFDLRRQTTHLEPIPYVADEVKENKEFFVGGKK
jgi:replicative DNA helicase